MPQEQTVYKAFEFTPNTTNVPSTMGKLVTLKIFLQYLLTQFTITIRMTLTLTMIPRRTQSKRVAQLLTPRSRQKYAI